MFKLVGVEEFRVGQSNAKIRIDPCGMFAYRYSLEVDGKPFRQFMDKQSKILKTWTVTTVDGTDLRVVLGKLIAHLHLGVVYYYCFSLCYISVYL